VQSKTCFNCLRELPVSGFHKNPGGKFGVRSDCIDCFRERRRSGEVQVNADRKRAKSRERYAANRDREMARTTAWIRSHPDNAKAIRSRYWHSHKEQEQANVREWHAKNPRKRVEYSENRRAMVRGAGGTFTASDIDAIYDRQGGVCAYCPSQLNGVFHIDHATPLSRGGSNWPDNLRVACPPCNLKKHDKTSEEFMSYLNHTSTRGG
jgi:5-methylcytosine-specific restriction endonuclease McrA